VLTQALCLKIQAFCVLLYACAQVTGGWVLDGQKRWIGNGTWADVAIVWARSSVDGQVCYSIMCSCLVLNSGACAHGLAGVVI
jgi:alkylation response protein AidB-like acyl-CoA dehydrogenase